MTIAIGPPLALAGLYVTLKKKKFYHRRCLWQRGWQAKLGPSFSPRLVLSAECPHAEAAGSRYECALLVRVCSMNARGPALEELL